ncbi:MAG: hypothetical protein CTY15_01240 [Methylocystis sp.]|nr:MAG: hypothetical protein CTY15_01240 [Methylocystis sp.]
MRAYTQGKLSVSATPREEPHPVDDLTKMAFAHKIPFKHCRPETGGAFFFGPSLGGRGLFRLEHGF